MMSLRRSIFVLVVGLILGVSFIGLQKSVADVVLTSVEAESMALPSSGSTIQADPLASSGQLVRMTANGDVTTTFNLSSPTNYFQFVSKGINCRGNWPRLMVYVDGTRVYNQLMSATNLTSFQVNTPLSAGTHQLRYNFSNASSNATCARTLFLDVARFYTLAPPAPTISFSAESTTLAYNSSTNLNWTSTNASTCIASGDWSGNQPTSGTYATGSLSSAKSYTLTCDGLGGSVSSTVNVSVLPPPAPTLTFFANPSIVFVGQNSNLDWQALNADTCLASGDWAGQKPTNGSEPTTQLNELRDYGYVLTCTGVGGEVSVLVTVSVQPWPAPTLDFSAESTTLAYNSSTNLNWSATNAQFCLATGSWMGDQPLAGNQPTGNLTNSQSYTLTCSGLGGEVSKTVDINVLPAVVPTVNLTVNPNTVYDGQTTQLDWSSTNADSCIASGDWAGQKSLSGSEQSQPVSVDQVYVLTCTGPGGESSSTAVVSVQPWPAPTLDFSAESTTLAYNNSTNLNWTSTNASTCIASGDWLGDKPTSGTESTGLLNEVRSYNYNLSCTGAGGTTESNVSVVVSEQPPAQCSVSDTSGCVPASEIVLTNTAWTCTQPLASYGALPLKVTINATQPYGGTGVTLSTGCAGDQDPNTIDLIVDVKGDGLTYGPNQDALKTKLQAGYNGGIQLTGKGNCGPRASTNGHQDGVQAQGGRDISFVDLFIGDYDNGISTCQGAGGAFFYSGANGYSAVNHHIIRGKYIGCVHGLGGTPSTGSVSNAFFRSGRNDGTDPVCVGYNAPRVCPPASSLVVVNIVCQKWNGSLDIWQDSI